MPILTTEQSIQIARAREDAKIHESTYAKHLLTVLKDAVAKAKLFEMFYGLVFRGQEPTLILTMFNRNEMWQRQPIETAKVLDRFNVMEDLQLYCGKCIHASWDFDENSSDIINVFLTFIPSKVVNDPEVDMEERRHDRATSW